MVSSRLAKHLAILIALVLVFALTLYYMVEGNVGVRLRIATTTSLYATGLLDVLAEDFEKRYPNVKLEFIPVGSGEALRRAVQGDVCLVLVHAPKLEAAYAERGIIGERRIFAYNYFVIVGPTQDVAGVTNAPNPVEAFKLIFEAGERGEALFISRGDSSGTHNRELTIWLKAKLNPQGRNWYLESGSSMDTTLMIVNERRAYTLSDISTFLKLKNEKRLPNIEMLYTDGEELLNVYSAYLVLSCTGREREYAVRFLEYLSREAQPIIAEYGLHDFGRPLFKASIDSLERLEKIWVKLSKE